MPARKTFANNAVLPAADLNTYVNPSTAAHVPDAVAAGTAGIPPGNAGVQSGPFAVAFPAGRFTQPPIVTATTNNTRLVACVSGVTQHGFNLFVGNWSPGAHGSSLAYWTAVQMTPTAANG